MADIDETVDEHNEFAHKAAPLCERIAELEAALREAWVYVPDHHLPTQAKIKAALGIK